MANARVKPKFDYKPITDLNGVDNVLREIAEIDRDLDLIEIDKNEKIDAIKEAAKEEAKLLIAQKDFLGKSLALYTEENKKDLIKDGKTVNLNFGKIGYRQSTSLETKSKVTWAKVLGYLEENNHKDCLTYKATVDKSELAKKEDSFLDKVGVFVKIQDNFFYEVNKEENPVMA